jgi:hypothetical protein
MARMQVHFGKMPINSNKTLEFFGEICYDTQDKSYI